MNLNPVIVLNLSYEKRDKLVNYTVHDSQLYSQVQAKFYNLDRVKHLSVC